MVEPPRRLGFYELSDKIGEGGMGRVYRAVDLRDRREVAIKLLSVELQRRTDQRLRFLREAQIGQRVQHPNVVRVHEFGEVHLHGAERTLFIAMELVAGRELHQLMSFAELGQRRVVEIGRQIAAALAVAHEAGIVHRDLKPHNVLVSSDGVAKLLDFGLAKLGGESEGAILEAGGVVGAERDSVQALTQVGAVIGTPGYAAPEQLRGEETTPRSDLFALGTMLYQLASHRLPYPGVTARDLLASMERGPAQRLRELAPGASPHLERIVMQLIEIEAGQRPASAGEVERELSELLSEEGAALEGSFFEEDEASSPAPPGLAARLRAWRRGRKKG